MKFFAVAKTTTPSDVSAIYPNADDGAIFCEIPELGFEDDNLIYCRYGLSIPYIQVKPGDKLWVEPTIGHDERWVYTGFADCSERIAPVNADEFFFDSVSGYNIYIKDDQINITGKNGQTMRIKGGKIYLTKSATGEPTENIILGQIFKAFMSAVLGELITLTTSYPTHTHLTTSPGNPTSVPSDAAAWTTGTTNLTAKKTSPIDDEAVLSDLSFTEKDAS